MTPLLLTLASLILLGCAWLTYEAIVAPEGFEDPERGFVLVERE